MVITEFKKGKFVSVALDRPAHILERHGINLDMEEIIMLADQAQGKEGIHVFNPGNSFCKTIVIRGLYEENGQSFGIFRTMWQGDEGSNQQNRGGLPYHLPLSTNKFNLRNSWNSSICSWNLSFLQLNLRRKNE